MMWKGFSGTRFGAATLAILSTIVLSFYGAAWAAQPEPWALDMQKGVTPLAHDGEWFHQFLLVIIFAIAIFVLVLLVVVMMRFNERVNPVPSKTSHNTALEIVWTIVPILILLIISIVSFKLLYAQYTYPKADVVLKATGHQWYWSYEYPGSDVSFDSLMVTDEDVLKQEIGDDEFNKKYGSLEGVTRSKRLYEDAAPIWKKLKKPRLLAVDNQVVVPVNSVVHVRVTASDVIHNWTIPSFHSKIDAVPGRVTQTWFRAEETGTFYGRCSELCGVRHAFMPIAVKVVEQDLYEKWLAAIKEDEDKARELLASADAAAEDKKHVAELQ